MLTIKHINDDGHEVLVSVSSVTFAPDHHLLIGYGDVTRKAEVVRYDTGHAYVMNENGKTVSMYNLRTK